MTFFLQGVSCNALSTRHQLTWDVWCLWSTPRTGPRSHFSLNAATDGSGLFRTGNAVQLRRRWECQEINHLITLPLKFLLWLFVGKCPESDSQWSIKRLGLGTHNGLVDINPMCRDPVGWGHVTRGGRQNKWLRGTDEKPDDIAAQKQENHLASP